MMSENITPKPGKHERPCPAMNGFIKSADCGAQRGSKLACPATCPHYPFGTSRESYDLFLKLDERWGLKMFDYLIAARGRDYFGDLFRQAQQPDEDQAGNLLAMSQGLFWGMFSERDRAGMRLVDRWEAEGFQGLNNDERLMTIRSAQSRATVIEVQKVLSDQHVTCVDLLAPGQPAFLVQDRSLSRKTVRFSRLLCWTSPLPHHTRLSAANISIPFDQFPVWREVMEQRLAVWQKQQPTATLQDLLAREFLAAATAVTEVGHGLYEQMIKNTDLHHCVGTYRLLVPVKTIGAGLAGRPDFDQVEPTNSSSSQEPLAQYDWLALGESADVMSVLPHASPKHISMVGKIRVYAGWLELETFSSKKYDWARARLDKLFGMAIRWERESIVDEALKRLEDRPHRDLAPDVLAVLEQHAKTNPVGLILDFSRVSSTLPPEKFTQAEFEKQIFADNLRSFLDHSQATLDGRTPRQAATDPALKTALVELIKSQLNQAAMTSRKHGIWIECDWMLDELGLAELK